MKPNPSTHPLLPVLMTASVDTRGMVGARYAAQEREQMYADALRFYLDNLCHDPRQKIVFCDNSGWDLASLRAKVGGGTPSNGSRLPRATLISRGARATTR